MLRYYLNLCLFSSFVFFSFALGHLVDPGTQFISYNGSISGYFKHPRSAPSNCSTYYFDSLQNTILKVGINPPWDTNPFYFNIQRSGQTADTLDPGDICVNPWGCTYDPIYDLFLETACYTCLTDDPVQILDLNKASTVQFDGKEKGYSTIGNQSTFVGNNNNNYNYTFDFQRPHNYTEQQNCAEALLFEWDAKTPFTYALNFTNTSAEALFTLTTPSGNMEFSFSGARVDAQDSEFDPYNYGNYTPIALDTSNLSHPNFMFANGTKIVWKNYSDGWDAIASSVAVPSVEIKNFGTALKWFSVMLVAGYITFT